MHIRPARLDDARWMGTRLRPEDAREATTVTGMSPQDSLVAALAASRRAYAALTDDGVPAILYGVSDCPQAPLRGSVWLMATPEVTRISKAFLEASSWILEAFHDDYPDGLFALADSRNDTHLRWLVLAGFKLHRETPVVVSAVPFIIATHV